jgi:E3 ubiquitin-protein ligase HUWE1
VPASTFLDLQRQLGRVVTTSLRVERAARSGETRNENRDLDPLFTLQRWAEEVKILHGQFVNERVDVLANHVVLALMPAAMELRKKMLEEQELAKARELKQKEEAESAAEARSDAAPTHEGASQADAETATTVDAPDIAVDVPNPPASATPTADPALDPVSGLSTETNPLATALDAATSDVHGEATSGDGAQASTSDGSASSARTRITVLIHGSEVDITDTGIDPTFLEALPDDMREEVLNQHVRDQRAARVERPPDSQISAEFLDALPPELRAEIIQQERQEQARRDRDARAQPTGVPAEIDAASFIASLDPQLREVVLMDQDDGFIQTLPSHMIAEVGSYRDDSRARRPHASHSAPRAAPLRPAARKGSVAHDAIQLLDKYGIAVLVRILFFPQVLKKTLLFKLLVNLCENAKSRTELFNLLLNILQDGTGDLAAVDKSFSQMSVRNSKSPSAQLPRTIGKQKASSDYFNGLNLPTVQHDAAPEVVAQRCLEALTFIVGANESSSTFFLTEHELPAGLRRAASKKGKGKERQAPQTHYPIVLLLGLLDRRSLVKTPSIMEAVVCLLATVTRPLTSLKDSANGHDSAAAASSLTSPPVATSTVAVGSILGGTGSHTSDPSALLPPVPPGIAGSVEHTRAPVQLESQPSSTPQVSPITTYMLTTESVSAPAQPAPEPAVVLPNDAGLLAHPPQIPHSALRLIVNILTVGECSGRTFQQSLALIQHLSHIPDARDVIAFELKSKAQEFGQIMYTDLDELVAALQRSSNEPLISSVASKFSTPSSEQARLLRVLKTIDYMYSTRTTAESVHTAADIEKVQGIYESFQFAPLWRRLGDCLAVIEEKPETEHIATVLLPLIETLMVVCKYVASKPTTSASTRAIRSSASPRSPTSARESMEDLFVTFTDAHRKVLNLMVRNNPSLMSGSFSLLVHNPRVLDFDNKRNYFTQQLHRRHNREHHPTLQLNVRRARVFEDSFQYLQRKTGEQIKYGKLSIRFYDEEGVDAGGVTREWFQILARQMFDPNNALFQPCAADRLTYQPNKNSWVNPEHLSFFKFVGRIIGKAIYDGRLLDAYFARSLYRQLLGKPVDYRDVEWVDPEYYNSLCWILENDPTVLELNFSVEADEVSRDN